MLYERWREIARSGPDEIALRDLPSGRRWTFRELEQAAGTPTTSTSAVIFPQGNSPEFVFSVLRGWRAGQVICPLESDQKAPGELANLPAGIVHLKTTSATAGMPRMIAFTGRQLAADAENIVATMDLRPEWPNLGAISLAHSYGFSNLVLPLLLHGVPLVLIGSAFPEALRKATADREHFTLAGVPALWRTWHEAGAIPGNIRLAISAGAPLPLSLEQAVFAAHGLKIHNFYGSSECGGIAYDATDEPRTDGACAGAPMKNVSLAVGTSGCLEIRSAAVGETYWPVAGPDLGNGVFRTSDLAEISDGLVYLRGRAGDQINVAGRKVSPELIERALLAHPSVRDCLVFGAPVADEQRSEIIVACVASEPGTGPDELRTFLLDRLAPWQLPREWWMVDSLKGNARGKLSRAEWRKRFLARPTPK